MAIPDMPNVPPQNVPVMIAQANQAQSGNVTSARSIGVCRPIPNGAKASPSAENGLGPIGVARDYFYLYEHQKIVTDPATITILQNTKHGVLAEGSNGNYAYLPEKGYVDKDSATFQVDFGGVKVNVKYYFQAVDLNTIGEGVDEQLCKKGYNWKISTTLDYNGNSAHTTAALNSWY
jgi:hypothetical protein